MTLTITETLTVATDVYTVTAGENGLIIESLNPVECTIKDGGRTVLIGRKEIKRENQV